MAAEQRRRPRKAEPPTEIRLPRLEEGQVVAKHYRLIQKLGQGGMGVVWLAEDTDLEVQRALKFLPPDMAHDRKARRRLEEEAKRVVRLRHANIVQVHSLEEDGAFVFFVMDYIPGWRAKPDASDVIPDLGELIWLEQGLSEKRVRELLPPILDALHYAHAFRDDKITDGLIHRDIKPANILLDADGRPLVADFGIAESIQSSMSQITGTGPSSGTLAYMSPEAIRGSLGDPRSDIYSLGMTIYEMFTGDTPFVRGDISLQHLQEPVPQVEGVSEEMNTLIQKCVAKEPEERWQSCEEMKDALDAEKKRREEQEQQRREAEVAAAQKTAEEEAKKRQVEEERKRREEEAKREEQQRKRKIKLTAVSRAEEKAKKDQAERERNLRPEGAKKVEAEQERKQEAREKAKCEAEGRTRLQAEGERRRQEEDRSRNTGKSRGVWVFLLLLLVFGVSTVAITQISSERKERELHQMASSSPRSTSRPPHGSLSPSHGDVETVDLGDGLTFDMVWIEGGTFQMGSPSSEGEPNDNEGPVHTVALDGFWMGKYEVTQEQYELIMGENPSNFRSLRNPVEGVSWTDARNLCDLLRFHTGRQFRLPTEAQWEYACRAGNRTSFSFGDSDSNLGDYAWYGSNSGGETHPVGQKRANAWGLYDIHGNVYEWCLDWYNEDYYSSSPRANPGGPPKGPSLEAPSISKYRVLRGGSWSHDPTDCRSANRSWTHPSNSLNTFGFRVVCMSRTLGDLSGSPEQAELPTAKVRFETTDGNVVFDHKLHTGEEMCLDCDQCHHAFEGGGKMVGMERERKCRACHYDRAKSMPKNEGDVHLRYIGASCAECHDREKCDTCHE